MASNKIRADRVSVISRGGLFLLMWWALTDGTASSWWIGVPAVLLAVIVSIALVPHTPLIWSGLLRFVPFFLLRSLLGGVDVARRALYPLMHIDPDLVDYPLRLPLGLPQVVLVNTVGLLPGTLIAEIDCGVLKVHVLDKRKDFLAELKAVEQGVARMFDISLLVSDGGE